MTRIKSTIELSGPLFSADPGKVFGKNVEKLMAALAREGEGDVSNTLRSGEGSRAPIRKLGDHTSVHAVGRANALAGKHWHATAIVSVNNRGFSGAQGVSLMAAAATVEKRTHAFRNTARRLRRSRKINVAELLKGIA